MSFQIGTTDPNIMTKFYTSTASYSYFELSIKTTSTVGNIILVAATAGSECMINFDYDLFLEIVCFIEIS